MKNKYCIGSHITERKFQQILKLFCLDIEAKKVAEITGVSRQSINKIYMAIRLRIFDLCADDSIAPLSGSFELDESYFGARRVRGIRGRGARGKTIVFGLLERNGHIRTYVVDSCATKDLLPIIEDHISIDSVVYTDGFKTYESLNEAGYTNHFVVHHGENEFAKENGIHTNGIENFWGLCKTRLAKFRGMNKTTFYLHLKECEFRYNYKDQNIYKILLKNFKTFPLKLS